MPVLPEATAVLLGPLIFLSAFLLFSLQPLIARAILPWFGGAASVWTACMLFFQGLLLVGYGYSHLSTQRLAPLRQGRLHLVLLGVSLLWLPIIPSVAWKPAPGQEPLTNILGCLALTVGLPYLCLSTTNPLLSAWASHRGDSTYRLFGLSNAGALLGLL